MNKNRDELFKKIIVEQDNPNYLGSEERIKELLKLLYQAQIQLIEMLNSNSSSK